MQIVKTNSVTTIYPLGNRVKVTTERRIVELDIWNRILSKRDRHVNRTA